jgi:hypothetical protein
LCNFLEKRDSQPKSPLSLPFLPRGRAGRDRGEDVKIYFLIRKNIFSHPPFRHFALSKTISFLLESPSKTPEMETTPPFW